MQRDHLTALRDLAQAMQPDGVALAVADTQRSAAPIWPEEAPAMARAIPRRRREFAAGRQAARMAMATLGKAARAIPGGADRAPVWPTGITGSISHDATSSIAIVARSSQYRALGIDVEPNAPLPDDLINEICVPSERTWLANLPAARRHLMARRIFCAKEAVFKAQFPLTCQYFGFDAVETHLNTMEPEFTARFLHSVGPIQKGTMLTGKCDDAGGHILALVTLGALRGMENARFPLSATG